MTLTEFLLARIAEDEAVAETAADDVGAERWVVAEYPFEGAAFTDAAHAERHGGDDSDPHCQHASRHDPARVLAECEAKRAVVELLEVSDYNGSDGNAWMTLIHLARVYRDHPDFEPAWT